jgi:2,3-bisphosphoglycerate-dependent phosphoglycerate mutase
MQLFFIRHGQSTNNQLYATTGSDKGRNCDPDLTEIGRKQAHLLAEYLDQGRTCITHLYTSLMVRAVSTGAVVAERLGLPLVAWPDLHEEGGIYLSDDSGKPEGQPGKDRAYFKEHFPMLVLPVTLGEGGWWNRPYETTAERPLRAKRLLNELFARHGSSDGCVAVISHGGFYNHVLSTLLNLPDGHGWWFVLNNTAITRIDFYPDRTDFVYHNRVHFLPPELIT